MRLYRYRCYGHWQGGALPPPDESSFEKPILHPRSIDFPSTRVKACRFLPFDMGTGHMDFAPCATEASCPYCLHLRFRRSFLLLQHPVHGELSCLVDAV